MNPADISFRARYITSVLLFFLAMYAGIYGVTYAYRLHHFVNFVCAWLVGIHFSTSGVSLSGLTQMLKGEDGGSRVKKRP